MRIGLETIKSSEAIPTVSRQVADAGMTLGAGMSSLDAVRNLLRDSSPDGAPCCTPWELAELLGLVRDQLMMGVDMVEQIGKQPN